MRMVADMGDEKSVLISLDTGIEQRPFTDHYSDFMKLFHDGDYVKLPTPLSDSNWPKDEANRVISIKKVTKSSSKSDEF